MLGNIRSAVYLSACGRGYIGIIRYRICIRYPYRVKGNASATCGGKIFNCLTVIVGFLTRITRRPTRKRPTCKAVTVACQRLFRIVSMRGIRGASLYYAARGRGFIGIISYGVSICRPYCVKCYGSAACRGKVFHRLAIVVCLRTRRSCRPSRKSPTGKAVAVSSQRLIGIVGMQRVLGSSAHRAARGRRLIGIIRHRVSIRRPYRVKGYGSAACRGKVFHRLAIVVCLRTRRSCRPSRKSPTGKAEAVSSQRLIGIVRM